MGDVSETGGERRLRAARLAAVVADPSADLRDGFQSRQYPVESGFSHDAMTLAVAALYRPTPARRKLLNDVLAMPDGVVRVSLLDREGLAELHSLSRDLRSAFRGDREPLERILERRMAVAEGGEREEAVYFLTPFGRCCLQKLHEADAI